jgi:hypothetical protein
MAAARPRFTRPVLDAIAKGMVIGIRAGRAPHRFIGIWAVVADGRVFVRSWSRKERSWWRTFLVEPRGRITVGPRELAVRAIQTRSERTKAAVDAAYLEKYATPASRKYVRDLNRPPCRDTTTELVPLR